MYFEEFRSAFDVRNEFRVPSRDMEGVNILFAFYEYVDYEGTAYVIFEKDGKLWDVEGGHCSCYGLEGQREPCETSWESLAQRMNEGKWYGLTNDAEEYLFDLIRKNF